jgi:hypothetical protein
VPDRIGGQLHRLEPRVRVADGEMAQPLDLSPVLPYVVPGDTKIDMERPNIG